jgi:hypothetical protein
MEIYARHLRNPQSVLAFHVSNRSLDLRPVLLGLAESQHLHLVRVLVPTPYFQEATPSDWVLMAADPAILQIPALAQKATPVKLAGAAVTSPRN